MRDPLYQYLKPPKLISVLALPLLTAASFSLVACSPPNQSVGPNANPASQARANPAPRQLSAPMKARSLKLRLKLDSHLLKSFGIKQIASLADCLPEITNVTTALTFPELLSPETQATLVAAGIDVDEDGGQTILTFQSTLQQFTEDELGLEYVIEDLPVGYASGSTLFMNSAGDALGYINYVVEIQETTGAEVEVLLRSTGQASALANCPRLEAEVSGGVLVQTGGDIVAAGAPVPSPTPPPATEPPEFTGMTPLTGYPLTQVTITGSNLTAVTAVRFGSLNAPSFNIDSDTQITAYVPALVAASQVTLINAAGNVISTEVFTPLTGARRLYVKPGGTGDGSSWAQALGSVTVALIGSRADDEIWVAAGRYTPVPPGGNRTSSFVMKPGVNVYGGFAGNETDLSERDWQTHITVLSGDLNGNDIYDQDHPASLSSLADNSFHVVGGASNAILDGFIISGGIALSSPPHHQGGGMVNAGSPTLRNLIFEHNTALYIGGGMVNLGNAAPDLENVTFRFNDAGQGGGMHNGPNTSPQLSQVNFIDNAATQGGGMFNEGAAPQINLSSFTRNTAKYFGGGMCNRRGASPSVSRTLFNENLGGSGGAIYNSDNSSPNLIEAIMMDNVADNGGALYNVRGSSPNLEQVSIFQNQASFLGGGIYNLENSSPIIHRTAIISNVAGQNGGGVYNRTRSSPRLVNVLIHGNVANRGGGVYNFNAASPQFRHVTMFNNEANEAAEMYTSTFSNPNVVSSIVWSTVSENPVQQFNTELAVSNSVVKGLDAIAHSGFGNMNINPVFVNIMQPAGPDGVFLTADDGLRLALNSPAKDFGLEAGMPTLDILGVTRESPPDLGAYEGTFEGVQGTLLIEDLEVGTGLVAEVGDTVTVSYVGTVEGSGVPLDSNTSFTFTIGAGTVIQGWEQGMPGMRVGGYRKLTIPPHLGYGDGLLDMGYDPSSNLIFAIELLDVQKP